MQSSEVKQCPCVLGRLHFQVTSSVDMWGHWLEDVL